MKRNSLTNVKVSLIVGVSTYSRDYRSISGKLGLWTLGKPYIIPGREPIGLSSLLKCSEIISLDLSSFMRVRTAFMRVRTLHGEWFLYKYLIS